MAGSLTKAQVHGYSRLVICGHGLTVEAERMGPQGSLPATLLLLLLLVLLPCRAQLQNSTEAESLLLAFKDTLDNGEAALPDWRRGTNSCMWSGIMCYQGMLVSM
jgi:hypothetical protein